MDAGQDKNVLRAGEGHLQSHQTVQDDAERLLEIVDFLGSVSPDHLPIVRAISRHCITRDAAAVFTSRFDSSLCTGTLRILWRVFLDRNMSVKEVNSALDSVIAHSIKRSLDVEVRDETLSDETLITFAQQFLPALDAEEWDFDKLTSYETFDDFAATLFANSGNVPSNFKKAMERAWEGWRPRIAALSPSLVTSITELNTEYVVWLKKHAHVLPSIAWEAFEKLIGEVFASRGFRVEFTGRLRNMSADLIAVRTDEFGVDTKYLIECKRYADSRRIGLDIVNSVIGAAQRANVDHAFLVTTSSFTEDVVRESNRLRELRLHLRDGDDVKQWLSGYTSRSEGGLWLADDWNASI